MRKKEYSFPPISLLHKRRTGENNLSTIGLGDIIPLVKDNIKDFSLPIILGVDESEKPYVADLAKLPHLLIGGLSGTGKSVLIHSIITSLLFSKTPDELKFVLIDPKMIELSLYSKIDKHYLAKIPTINETVLTDLEIIVKALDSVIREMDKRYWILNKTATKNIIEYNDKIKEQKFNPNERHRLMPYIVVIVDEFGDLIKIVGKEIEYPLARLAQKARAVGIHLIISTQIPSRNIVTGNIKGNFLSRISFKVNTAADSRVILDMPGAELLSKRGEMITNIYHPFKKLEGIFVDTAEIERLCDYISNKPVVDKNYLLPLPLTKYFSGEKESNLEDSLFEEVARMVVRGKASPILFLESQIHKEDKYKEFIRKNNQFEESIEKESLSVEEILCLQFLGVEDRFILKTSPEDFEILYYKFPNITEEWKKAEKVISSMEKQGIKIYKFSDPSFPEQLRKIGNECPPIIYLQGNHELLNNLNTVAIIGSRDCSQEGRKKSYKLGFEYGRRGNVVISGLALGCDTEAHIGCLDWRGKTVAIVGSGLDITYPRENIKLKERILSEGGLLVSEHPFGIKANPRRLIARCRLQVALSEKIIVAECKVKSGTMETVNFAQKYGKEILATTYPIYNEYNMGNKYLIENQIAKPL